MLETTSTARRIFLAGEKARATLQRKTQPEPRSYVYRGGYNVLTSTYTGSIELGRLSGSSLNRQDAKIKKLERLEALKENKEEAEKYYKMCDELAARKRQVVSILENAKEHKRRLERIAPATLDGRKDRFGDAGETTQRRMSVRTRGKVRDKAIALHRVLDKDKTFMTLTFINQVEDKQAVRILNSFLTTLRNESKNKIHYLWVAEKQTENKEYQDNIHFHMIINKKIKIFRMNALWVLCQYNAGIRFKDVSYSEMKSRYEISMNNNTGRKFSGSIEEILNPLDVEKIKSIYGLNYYLTKYITKNKSEGFDCLAWHCSRVVSRLFTRTVVHRSTFSAAMSIKNIRVNQTTGECNVYKESRGAFHHCVFIQNRNYFLPMLNEMEQINRWILDGMDIGRIPMIDDEGLKKYFMDAAIKN